MSSLALASRAETACLSTAVVEAWSDDVLLERQRLIAAERRRLDADAAVVAGEIGRRSSRDRGYSGLAVQQGARSPAELIQRLTGGTAREARSLISVGELMATQAAVDPISLGTSQERPWLIPVSKAIAEGRLGIAAADAIRAGLGEPSPTVASSGLVDAAVRLIEDAERMGADRLAARARDERSALDSAGVAEREAERRSRRFLKLIPQWDGMTRVIGLLDPESAALVTDAFDRVSAPRRHGPRFVDEAERARDARIVADPRTTDQLIHDAFVEMISVATRTDDGTIFGSRVPAVRVHVRGESLARREGSGRIEGQGDPISISTVERAACEGGFVPIGFDSDGQVVNVGRSQRLFTYRQRIGLAARDGGCRFPDCDRPPSWTEAHHIDEWQRDNGRTDIAEGVLLCLFHHRLVHNDGWRITRRAAEYFAVPPPRPGVVAEPIPMPARMRL
ncbi:MAG TPA: DUF222 domain-containing protein [Pseudolysinimonas sp.]|nr:DUF222 domain-containing protein [Pseudolysinimonas sp.]